jgi:hypothetical protein
MKSIKTNPNSAKGPDKGKEKCDEKCAYTNVCLKMCIKINKISKQAVGI